MYITDFSKHVFVLLAFAGIPNAAQANWLANQWENFRTYPRMEKAYDLINKGDDARARALLEDVYKIDPSKRETTAALANLCARQSDMECIRRLGRDWLQRAPTDGVGHLLLAYAAALSGDDNQVIQQVPQALKLGNLTATQRTRAAGGWMEALLRQHKNDEARQALQFIQQQNIVISHATLQRWNQDLNTPVVVRSALIPEPVAALVSEPALSVVQSSVPASVPVVVPVEQVIEPAVEPAKAEKTRAVFPYRAVSDTERLMLLAADFQRMVSTQNYDLLEKQLVQLQQARLYDTTVRELLSNALQGKNCPLLLQEIPVNDNPKKTTARTQMAAAYCSQRDPDLAAQHFEAASSLRRQAGQLPSIAVLRGEGEAWLAAGQFDLALQRWEELQERDNDPQQGRRLTAVALQHPDLPISTVITKKYPQYFAAGVLTLQAARQARSSGDLLAAETAYQKALAEKPDAAIWYELAAVHSQKGQGDKRGAALAEAVRLEPNKALFQAEYGYWLKENNQRAPALVHLQKALVLEPQRVGLLPEIALLEMRLGQTDAAIRDWRASIDQHQAIQADMGVSGVPAEEQLYNWQRTLQVLEDRWSWYLATRVRLDNGPDTSQATSPMQYAQYSGSLDAGLAYRLNPIWDAAHPTWLFARTSQGLQDQSLRFVKDNNLGGVGVRQSLLADAVLYASAEWLVRDSAEYRDDVMLRLSGSHSLGTDWQPKGAEWNAVNMYADAAWLVRAQSYYLTLSAEAGRHYRLSWLDGKSTLMPYVSTSLALNDDNTSHSTVSRLDVGAGIALNSWHRGDDRRAPDLRHRLALEARQAIGGNASDHHTVMLQWSIYH